MTTFMDRAKRKARGIDLPDTSTLREHMPDTAVLRARVMAAVEEALDRAEDAWHDAPTATKGAAKRVRSSRAAEATAASADKARNSRVGEATSAAVAAGLPVALSFVRDRARSKAARRAAMLAPKVALRSSPVLLGAAAIGGVALGVAAVRRLRAEGSDAPRGDAHYELSNGSAASLDDDDVQRMEGEGGDLGAYDSDAAQLRRFVRSADGVSGSGGH